VAGVAAGRSGDLNSGLLFTFVHHDAVVIGKLVKQIQNMTDFFSKPLFARRFLPIGFGANALDQRNFLGDLADLFDERKHDFTGCGEWF
jgi:hypothetical protein